MSSSYSTVFWFSLYLDYQIIKKSMIRIMMIILLMIICSDEWIYEMMKIFIILMIIKKNNIWLFSSLRPGYTRLRNTSIQMPRTFLSPRRHHSSLLLCGIPLNVWFPHFVINLNCPESTAMSIATTPVRFLTSRPG